MRTHHFREVEVPPVSSISFLVRATLPRRRHSDHHALLKLCWRVMHFLCEQASTSLPCPHTEHHLRSPVSGTSITLGRVHKEIS